MDKYRAWDSVNCEMLNNVGCINWHLEEITCYEKVSLDFSMEFKHIRLMRFTGIVDKNGKEIYEGDILHWTDKSKPGYGTLEDTVKVYWDNEFLAWTVQGNDWSVDEPPQYLFEYNEPGELEIIGNIYEGVTRDEAI